MSRADSTYSRGRIKGFYMRQSRGMQSRQLGTGLGCTHVSNQNCFVMFLFVCVGILATTIGTFLIGFSRLKVKNNRQDAYGISQSSRLINLSSSSLTWICLRTWKLNKLLLQPRKIANTRNGNRLNIFLNLKNYVTHLIKILMNIKMAFYCLLFYFKYF